MTAGGATVEFCVRGSRVRSRTSGLDRRSTTAVLLVHGAGMDHTVWSPVTEALDRQARPYLAVDLPGHGASGGAPLASIAGLADWLAAFIAAAGLTRPVVAGHSMGAAAVLELAARYPETVRGVALLGVAAAMPVHPDLLALATTDTRGAATLIAKWGVAGAARESIGPRVAATIAGASPGVLANDLGACAAYAGGLEAATRICCPALVLLGAADRMTPPAGADPLLSAMRGARRLVLPETGHMLMLEAPEAVAAALISFAEEVP